MELVEPIEYINEQLIKRYGNEPYADDLPRFRVVFSDSQVEKRWVTHTKEGFELIHPQVSEVKKYWYIEAKYVLERLVPIDTDNTDLTTKVGYEPAHVFMTPSKEYLPPRFDMCTVVADRLLDVATGRVKPKKKVDPATEPGYMESLYKRMYQNLYGNETSTTDALAYNYGVTNPAGPEHFEPRQNNSTDKVEKESVKVESNVNLS